ncbi:unnamed protein product [Amoebophrya sp. A120]|nr:unnamed protein product [Amoebophrya sp. A120]|eukprot:GSA120T00007734001.1
MLGPAFQTSWVMEKQNDKSRTLPDPDTFTFDTDIQFTKDRAARRMTNMMEEDRVKFYNWNLACIAVTGVPLAYYLTVNYNSSDDTDRILRVLDPDARSQIGYYPGIMG